LPTHPLFGEIFVFPYPNPRNQLPPRHYTRIESQPRRFLPISKLISRRCISYRKLRRDPHLLGWSRPLSTRSTCPMARPERICTSSGVFSRTWLRGPQPDPRGGFPATTFEKARRPALRLSIRELFEARIQTSGHHAATGYNNRLPNTARRFLSIFQTDFPQMQQLENCAVIPSVAGSPPVPQEHPYLFDSPSIPYPASGASSMTWPAPAIPCNRAVLTRTSRAAAVLPRALSLEDDQRLLQNSAPR